MKYFVFPFVVLIFACSENMLLEQRPHTKTAKTVFNTEKGATEALMGIYDILQWQEDVARFEMVGEYCSPDVYFSGAPGGNGSPYQGNYMRFILDEYSGEFSDTRGTGPYWDAMYKGIYQCNLLIEILEDKENLVNFQETNRDNILGEVYFLRGLFEFKLLIIFAGMPQLQQDFNNQLMGLPFYDHVPLPDEYYPDRPSLTESWNRVIIDFQNASHSLPLKSEYPNTDIGRATKGAAQAMLAKTYIYIEEWEEAFNMAEAIINSGEYWLEGDNVHSGDYTVTRTSKEGLIQIEMPAYKWIFQPEGDNHGGAVFSIQYLADHLPGFSQNVEGNRRIHEAGPRAVIAYDEETGEFTSVNFLWGMYCPTSFFVETAYKEAGGINELGEITDPRFKLSVISVGDSVPYYYKNDSIRELYPDSVLFDAWNNWPCTGYSMWKYFPDPIFILNSTNYGDFDHDIHYLRYADVLLMAAEAAFHIGQTGKALNYVNQVRTRARNSGTTGYPRDLTQISLGSIYAERRVELAFEGHAFFDLVRTKRIKSELERASADYGTVIHPEWDAEAQTQFSENFNVGVNEIFPIPYYEVELSGGSLKQNPGY